MSFNAARTRSLKRSRVPEVSNRRGSMFISLRISSYILIGTSYLRPVVFAPGAHTICTARATSSSLWHKSFLLLDIAGWSSRRFSLETAGATIGVGWSSPKLCVEVTLSHLLCVDIGKQKVVNSTSWMIALSPTRSNWSKLAWAYLQSCVVQNSLQHAQQYVAQTHYGIDICVYFSNCYDISREWYVRRRGTGAPVPGSLFSWRVTPFM